MYDIIFITSNRECLKSRWEKIKSNFPMAKQASTFKEANKKSFTKFFWAVWDDVDVLDEFKFDYLVTKWDSEYIHVFKNGNTFDGVCLFPKNAKISERELNHRFFVNKKEVDIQASRPVPYERYNISSYDEYLAAIEKTSTDMFWAVFKDLNVLETFDFNYYIPKYDYFHRHITHVFKNGKYYDGVCLFSKNNIVSKREFEHRFFVNKKEVDIQASRPVPYERYNISSYDEYLAAIEKTSTSMFYAIFDDIVILDNFKFDFHVPFYEQMLTHVFKNGKYYDGVCLFSKNNIVNKREFDHRFFVNKKEVDIVASTPKPFDIVFISYNEPNADENYQKLLDRFPRAMRVHGVKGIHQAHIEAAKKANTEMFWVIDADAVVDEKFNFNFEQVPKHDTYSKTIVHVWKSRNPINGLEYGYGGIKLLPRSLTLKMDISKPDMTTSISPAFKAMDEVSNMSMFNTDPFNTWKSAFRECAKLASKVIDRQVDEETHCRLKVWCTVGKDKIFGEYAIAGAIAGKKFAEENPEEIYKINDFSWLYEQFSKHSI